MVIDNQWGKYAKDLIEAELGLDNNYKQILGDFGQRAISRWTNYSAVAGLSSPTSGIKNTLIQIPRTAAVYGMRNTAKAIARAGWGSFTGDSYLNLTERPSKAYMEGVKKGYTEFGVKSYQLEQTKFFGKLSAKWWFDNVNLMTKTENFNRIVSAEAGRLFFQNALGSLRGDNSWFNMGQSGGLFLSAAMAERMMKETWRLKPEEIEFLKMAKGEDLMERGNIDKYMYDKIMMKVGHFSHVSSAGGTAASMLPLWMSNKYLKPMTLFQRMATSTTFDSYNNYLKPLAVNGNPMPLIKATIGHGLAGWALYAMYDWAFDQQNPKEQSPFLDRVMNYVWRGEMLGVFGDVLSPYEREIGFNPLMEPIIIRNAKAAGHEMIKMYATHKSLDDAVYDFARKSVVILGQGTKVWDNYRNPMVGKFKRIKSLEDEFRRQKGGGFKRGKYESLNKVAPYYQKLRAAVYFGSEQDIAKEYWKAFDYIASELKDDGFNNLSIIKSKTHTRLKQVINGMNPIQLSSTIRGRDISKRDEFVNWLNRRNRKLADEIETYYYVRRRKVLRSVRLAGYEKAWSIFPYGKHETVLPNRFKF